MSRWVEVWTQPQTGSFTKKIAFLPWARVGFNRKINGVGTGQVTVPQIFPRLDEITDPDNNTGSLIRMWEDGYNVASFFAEEVGYDEKEDDVVTISGPGIEEGLEKGIIYPWDWTPGSTETKFPDWVYGLGTNEVADPGFEDDPTFPLVNGDAEEGTLTGWSSRNFSEDTGDLFELINNPSNAYEGDFFFKINPGKYHSGIVQNNLRVYPGKTNTFSARIKEPGGLGKRFTFGVQAPEGTVGNGLNQFYYKGEIMAELDNVAQSGGSSDGTWQLIDLDITWGPEVEETYLFAQFDHHPDTNGPEYWVDAVTMAGFGVGVGDWEAVGLEFIDIFEGSTDEAYDGARSLKLVMNGVAQPVGGAGVKRPINFEQGAPYYVEVWLRTPTAGTPTVRLTASQKDGGATISTTTVDLVVDTWTKIFLEFEPLDGIYEGFLTLAWDETTAGTLYADDFMLRTGLSARNAGRILNEHLTEVTTRAGGASALLWLKWDGWDGSLDSNGTAWPEDLAIRVPRGQTIRQLLDQLGQWGYEWEIVWNVGADMYELKFYTKSDGATGGAGDPVPDIRLITGKSFRQGMVRLRDAGPNTFLAEGLEGSLYEKQDGGLLGGYGRIEEYLPQDRTDESTTLESLVDAAIVVSKNSQYGVKASLFERPFPGIDFHLGDRPEIDLPPHLPDNRYRVVGYTGAWEAKDNFASYSLDFSSQVFDEPFGGTTSTVTSAGLNYLLGLFKRMPDTDRLSIGVGGADPFTGPIVPTYLVAAWNARPEIRAVADFVCDGTDDQDKINSAIQKTYLYGGGWGSGKGGRVILSGGEFNTTGQILVGSFAGTGPMHLMGMGEHATFINAVIPASAPNNESAVRIGDLSPCSISNMSIDAVLLNSGVPYALHVGNVNGGRVENLHIISSDAEGAVLANSHRTTYVNVLVLNPNAGHGFVVSGDWNRFFGCEVEATFSNYGGHDPAGFYVSGNYNVLTSCLANTGVNYNGFDIFGYKTTLIGCNSQAGGTTSKGILVSADGCVIANCIVEFVTTWGIHVANAADSVIIGNTIDTPGGIGIQVDSERVVVANNSIQDWGSTGSDLGIILNGADPICWGNTVINGSGEASIQTSGLRSIIGGNKIYGSPDIGIDVQETDALVVGNHVFSSVGHGIKIGSADGNVVGNTVKDAGDVGILIDNWQVLVDGNRITDPTNDGIQITANSTGSMVGVNLITGAGGLDINDLGTDTVFTMPLTTKGDLYTFSTVPDRLPVGADGETLVADSAEATGLKWVENINSERWSMSGVVTVTEGDHEITWSTDIEIIEIEARVKVAPTGSAVVIDMHVNDTTSLYTTQPNRPSIATSTKSDITTPDITTITAGDPVRIDVDEKDSSDVAAGLVVTVRYRQT